MTEAKGFSRCEPASRAEDDLGEIVSFVLVPPGTSVCSPEANGLVCCCRKGSGLECYLESIFCAAA